MDKIHAVCPHCRTVNAVLPDRLNQNPVCAKCRTTLFPDHPLELTDQTFERFVSRSSLPVVVDFWAPWCGPCKMMGPAFAQAAPTLRGKALLAKVDTQGNQAVAARFGIQSVPSLLIFKSGREQARTAGAMPAARIVQWVLQNL